MGEYTCDICGVEFDHPYEKKTCSDECANKGRSQKATKQWSERGEEMKQAVGEAMNRPEVREYMSKTQMGDDNSMAGKNMAEYGMYKPYAPYKTNASGYPMWRSGAYDSVLVHRLMMVAKHGFDALDGMHVHHKNEIRWDNRPSNLELMTPSEHATHHNMREQIKQ